MLHWTQAYITTGELECFYVLRVSGHYFSKSGRYPRDRYVLNLGRDFQKAIEKAKVYVSKHLDDIPISIPDTPPNLYQIERKARKCSLTSNFDEMPPF